MWKSHPFLVSKMMLKWYASSTINSSYTQFLSFHTVRNDEMSSSTIILVVFIPLCSTNVYLNLYYKKGAGGLIIWWSNELRAQSIINSQSNGKEKFMNIRIQCFLDCKRVVCMKTYIYILYVVRPTHTSRSPLIVCKENRGQDSKDRLLYMSVTARPEKGLDLLQYHNIFSNTPLSLKKKKKNKLWSE